MVKTNIIHNCSKIKCAVFNSDSALSVLGHCPIVFFSSFLVSFKVLLYVNIQFVCKGRVNIINCQYLKMGKSTFSFIIRFSVLDRQIGYVQVFFIV